MKLLVVGLLGLLAAERIGCDNVAEPSPPNGSDTTSQNFSISTWEYGDGYESSWASSAWVFDQNNIWITGYFPDTVGGPPHNILRWDGAKWNGYGRFFNSSGINCIWSLDSSHVYLADGLVIIYGDGFFSRPDFTRLPWSSGQSVDYVWASSDKNVWGVGASGCVVHYDGIEWKKIACDTTVNFHSITGSPNSGVAYATGWTFDYVTYVVRLAGDSVEILLTGGNSDQSIIMPGSLLRYENELWVTGSRIRLFQPTTRSLSTFYTPSVYTTPIAMAAPNDIFMAESYYGSTVLLHFNGARFNEFQVSTASTFWSLPQIVDTKLSQDRLV